MQPQGCKYTLYCYLSPMGRCLSLLLSSETSNIHVAEPVTTERSGRRGRPRKDINIDLLREIANPKRRIPLTKMAKKLGVHRHTLRSKLKENNMDTAFSTISNNDLDGLIKSYRESHSECGQQYIIGFLRQQGLRVQTSRVRASLARIDRLGQTLRRQKMEKTKRRQYQVPRPNALWHIDGHHKLILWGIVIHGVVDGYSRTVCFQFP